MLLRVPQVLDQATLAGVRGKLDSAAWADGKATAGHQSSGAKHNLQLPTDDALASELGSLVTERVRNHPTFFSGALPKTIFPPLFNCYREGGNFAAHIDNAVRYDKTQHPPTAIRTDLSATLFLSEPDSYDGGELVVEDTFGTHRVKLPAGDLILYPASSLHHVTPVTRGARVASFFWVQSMIRDDGQRQLLFDLDLAIQRLGADIDINHPSLLQLTGTYHNLLRRWADV